MLGRGMRMYSVYSPPEAVGVWVGSWTFLVRLFTQSAGRRPEGERAYTLAEARHRLEAATGEQATVRAAW